jgi:hypothetical protein
LTPAPSPGGEPGAVVVAASDVHERYSASRLLLLPGRGDAVELNGPAALVWEVLREESTVEEVVRLVADAYHEDPQVVTPLVRSTVDQLQDHGLVTTTA